MIYRTTKGLPRSISCSAIRIKDTSEGVKAERHIHQRVVSLLTNRWTQPNTVAERLFFEAPQRHSATARTFAQTSPDARRSSAPA